MIIDMHSHWRPPVLIDALRARTEAPLIETGEARNEDAARHAIRHGNAEGFLGHLATLAPFQEAAE